MHEIGFGECHKAVAFKGSKDYSAQRVQELLHISNAPRQQAGQPAGQQPQQGGRATAIGKYLMTVGDCSFTVESILEDLGRDPRGGRAGASKTLEETVSAASARGRPS